jgi:2'-5' RNA ligase
MHPAHWVKIKKSVPPQVVLHINRGKERGNFTTQDLLALWEWYDTNPSAPPGQGPNGSGTPRPYGTKGARPGDWYVKFPKFTFVGNGDMPQSLLTGTMSPWGMCLGNFGAAPRRAKLLCKHRDTSLPRVLAGMKSKPSIGTVQANLPEDSEAYEAVIDIRDEIDRSDLDGNGIRTGPIHITVRYGIQTEDTGPIEAYLSTLPTMEAVLGSTESFPPSESSDNAAVLIAPVECPELFAVNSSLADHGDFTDPDFEYRPHVTIAYLQPGKESKYVDKDWTKGKTFTIREVTVITPGKDRKTITLNGKALNYQTPIKGEVMGKRAKLLRHAGEDATTKWLDQVLARPDASSLYLHGSQLVFHEFRKPDYDRGQLVFFTKVAKGMNMSEYFGANLYLCKLGEGTRFDPETDANASKVLTKILGKAPGGLFGKKRIVLTYEELPLVVPHLHQLGYDRFKVFYPARNKAYDAVSDTGLISIVETRPVDWENENQKYTPQAPAAPKQPPTYQPEERRVANLARQGA